MEGLSVSLRPLEPEDFPAVAALVKDEAVARYMRFDCARTDREARAVFDQYYGCGAQAVLVDGTFAGVFSKAPSLSGPQVHGLGLFLAPRVWGKGVAGRVLAQAVQKAREEKEASGVTTLEAHVVAANTASCRALLKNGFTLWDVERFPDLEGPLNVYRLML